MRSVRTSEIWRLCVWTAALFRATIPSNWYICVSPRERSIYLWTTTTTIIKAHHLILHMAAAKMAGRTVRTTSLRGTLGSRISLAGSGRITAPSGQTVSPGDSGKITAPSGQTASLAGSGRTTGPSGQTTSPTDSRLSATVRPWPP